LLLKCGWLDVPKLTPYIKIFNPKTFIENRFKNKIIAYCVSTIVRGVLSIRDTFSDHGRYQDIIIQEIKEFGMEYDKFFDFISPHFGIIVVRKQKYLNWKFVDKPFNNYRCFKALNEKNELSGYVVIKKEIIGSKVRGKILDILVDPSQPKIFSALVTKALAELSNNGADYVSIICTHTLFKKKLVKLGFLRAKTMQYFMVNNWEDHYEKEFVSNIDNWYLSYSDADGDAWEVENSDQIYA
jgi:hypothetical protein